MDATDQTVRPRFVATLITLLLLPMYLAAAVQPVVLLYVVGVLIPFTWLAIRCWRTPRKEYADLVSTSQARVIYLFSLAAATGAYLAFEPAMSICWFFSAAWFLCYEPVVYNTLVAFGLAPGTRGYKDYAE